MILPTSEMMKVLASENTVAVACTETMKLLWPKIDALDVTLNCNGLLDPSWVPLSAARLCVMRECRDRLPWFSFTIE